MGGFFAISLGGNFRNTRRAFDRALRVLVSNKNLGFTGCSPVLRTEPWEIVSPAFLNQVVTGYSRIGAPGLWELLVRTERREIRRGKGKQYPRTLDLDFLLFEGVSSPRRDLVLPHPRLSRRPELMKLLALAKGSPRSAVLRIAKGRISPSGPGRGGGQ